MPEIDDASVHLVVTSPPYWQLKDYGAAGQIGFDDTYADYVRGLGYVWEECRRVLAPGCRLCVNIGDQFARSAVYGRYRVVAIRADVIRVAEAIGFEYLGAIIWQKKTTMNTTGGAVVMGSYPYPRNGIVEIDYEHILLFRKPGRTPAPSQAAKEASRLSKEEWKEFFSGHWRIPPARQKEHMAVFPEEIPARLIRMFTFVGETVLDPFLGSGTTAVAALKLGRDAVGYEANPDFEKVIHAKLAPVAGGNLLRSVEISFGRRTGEISPPASPPWFSVVRDLPLQPRVSPKKRSYGSVIDAAGTGRRNDLFSVRGCEGEDIMLSDGRCVRLADLQITDMSAFRTYVAGRLRGKRVRLTDVRDGRVRMRLKNGISVNDYLIKAGIAVRL